VIREFSLNALVSPLSGQTNVHPNAFLSALYPKGAPSSVVIVRTSQGEVLADVNSIYRIASLPARGEPNPYVDLFYDALSPHGIELVGKLIFNNLWLKRNLDNFDAIHLHWPELIWRNYRPVFFKYLRTSNCPGSWRAANYFEANFRQYFNNKKIDWFKKNVLFLKRQGKEVLYTWHNVEPHEECTHVDWAGNQVLAEYADLIIFHSAWAEKECRRIYNIQAPTVVMPHGNYYGVYPPPRNRYLVAKELGIDPEKPIVGCLGAIRDYKGVDLACEALTLLNGRIQLLCAGKPHGEYDLHKLQQYINNIEGSVLIPKLVTDQEFSDYANLCNILLFPYKKVTGSGALLAALTLGKGVVASDLPFFKDVLSGQPNAGVLVKEFSPKVWAKEIESYLNLKEKIRSDSALKISEKYSWDNVVKPVVTALKEIQKSHV